jgi:hypothetical protein
MVKPEDLTTVSSYLGNRHIILRFDSFVIVDVVNAPFFAKYLCGNFGECISLNFLFCTIILVHM